MNTCPRHPDIAFLSADCPICELKRELAIKESRIDKLMKFRMSIADDKLLNLDLVSKATGWEKATIYHYNSTHGGNEKIPFQKQGKNNVIRLSKLKKWAELNNKALDLTKISIL